jgi:anaerobic magnesium-protoporphyrin IX monomethyl ester cyclase
MIKMKVILINPPFSMYAGVKGHGGSAPPLNLAYIAAFLRQKRKDRIAIIDCEALRLKYKDIEKRLKEMKPEIIGITAPTPAFQQVLNVAEIAKKVNPKIKVIIGGPHASAFPEDSVMFKQIDYVIVGEGEETFCELVSAIEDGTNLSKIDGLVYKKGKKAVRNPPRAYIKNLDELPFPARDMLPMHLYFPPPTKRVGQQKNNASIIGSRGCPFNCTYCIATLIWGRCYRPRSPKNIVDEMEECYTKYGLREFNFHDELFTTKKDRTIEICKEIIRRKLEVTWLCMARVDFIDQEMLHWMKKAGCQKIVFGFESGSEEVLKEMRKRANLKQAREAARLVKESGINLGANFMFGHIGETKKTIRQTIDFAKEINADTVAFLVACPYPGTDFFNISKEKGYLRKDFHWKDFVIVTEDTPLINLPGLKAEEILRSVKRAYWEYYLRPAYIWQKMKKIRSVADIKNLLEGVKMLVRIS